MDHASESNYDFSQKHEHAKFRREGQPVPWPDNTEIKNLEIPPANFASLSPFTFLTMLGHLRDVLLYRATSFRNNASCFETWLGRPKFRPNLNFISGDSVPREVKIFLGKNFHFCVYHIFRRCCLVCKVILLLQYWNTKLETWLRRPKLRRNLNFIPGDSVPREIKMKHSSAKPRISEFFSWYLSRTLSRL